MTINQVASPPETRSAESSDLSSPLSWQTAPVTPGSHILLPIRETPRKRPEEHPAALYRPAKSLPYELIHHCLVYFEEQLYASALTLLNNLLISGTSFPTFPTSPAFVPPPNHLALVATLLVHPLHTSGASSRERLEVSSESLILLRNVLATLGPVGGNLIEAFLFSSSRRRRRAGGYFKRESSTDNEIVSPISGDGNINSPLAKDGSLWIRAQDFWHVVGWAFNCSIRYEKRWEYWRVWLEYMLDVLKADWDERARLDEQENKSKRSLDPQIAPAHTWLRNSLLLGYLPERGGSSSAVRRVVKSIFADGSVESMRAFPEVFENETRERNQQAGSKRKRVQKVDVDDDNYGDYSGEDEYEGDAAFDSSQPTPPPSRDQDDIRSSTADYSTIMGDPEAIALRLRLLALLSLASDTISDGFANVHELYSLLYEHISSLSLPQFSRIISSASLHLPPAALSSLSQLLLDRLFPNSVPRPSTDELTQDMLERYFFPFAAHNSSIEDNAKVSLLLEALFRLLVTVTTASTKTYSISITPTPKLAAAIEQGIAAREAKCTSRRRKLGVQMKEEYERSCLGSSAARIRLLLQFIQSKAGGRSKG